MQTTICNWPALSIIVTTLYCNFPRDSACTRSVYKFVLARPVEFLPFHSCSVIPVIVADHHVEVVDVSGRHRNGDLGPPGHAQPGALLVPPVSAVFLVQFATPFAGL